YWHKGCFHCEVCKMALNMNNYKGYEKKPYCNALAPLVLAETTPEMLELKQGSKELRPGMESPPRPSHPYSP
ncbi:hypothetical protein FD754_017812, partial [Muntiacus muntjak]